MEKKVVKAESKAKTVRKAETVNLVKIPKNKRILTAEGWKRLYGMADGKS